ncbi:hypothetical protein PHYPSEUDO_010691 [Phytophthora pseudosyringae]|uniref:M96 mating-specific protein family n=1 Tax=Phytophthora pseudosyringae TaxID=221518 RepID=A0A8T1V9N8_9STRA|nr:hypothetical protein PHYPSEUDO_010691 [Phytophthora pseudosyringae]
MSLLLSDDDKVLEEVFALIDSSDFDSGSEQASVTQKQLLHASTSTRQPHQQPVRSDPPRPSKSKLKKKRIRRPETSSTAFHRRKKAEILALREEAQVLELRLKSIKETERLAWEKRLGNTTSDAKGDTLDGYLWLTDALQQYRRRDEAEGLNRKLKALWASQLRVSDSIRAVLLKPSTLLGLDIVCSTIPQGPTDTPTADIDMPRLRTLVDLLYLQTDTVVHDQGESLLRNFSGVTIDQHRGKTAQFHNTTPLACSIETARDFIWSDFQRLRTPGHKPHTLEKTFTMTTKTKAGVLSFDRLHSLRRYVEKDRFVVVCSDVMTLQQSGLRFRSEGWLVVSRANADPDRACVARNFKQLFLDVELTGGTREGDCALVKEIALETLIANFQEYVDCQQKRLLESPTSVGIVETENKSCIV